MWKPALIIVAAFVAFALDVSAQVDTAWVRIYAKNGTGSLWSSDMEIDGQGNLIVAGSASVVSTDCGMHIVKYASSGDLLWSKQFNGNDSSCGIASVTASGPEESVYIGGGLSLTSSIRTVGLVKYNSFGIQEWAAEYFDEDSSGGFIRVMEIDADGNIVAVGWIGENPTTTAILKFDPAGNLLWSARYFGESGEDTRAYAIATDNQSNIYCTGHSNDSLGVYGARIWKYSSAGTLLWKRHYVGLNGRRIHIAQNGDPIVGAWGLGAMHVIRLNSDGDEGWHTSLERPGRSNGFLSGLVLDKNQNLLAIGWTGSSATELDITVCKITPSGTVDWMSDYDGPVSGTDRGMRVIEDGRGGAYASGVAEIPQGAAFTIVHFDSVGSLVSDQVFDEWVCFYVFGGPWSLQFDEDSLLTVTGGGASAGPVQEFITLKATDHWRPSLDILPLSCPNIIQTGDVAPRDIEPRPGPAAVAPDKPTVPVALLGTATFDVSRVDPATILIEGLAPVSHRLADVSRPVDVRETDCDCTDNGADGFIDLVLEFDQEQLLAAIAPVTDGVPRALVLSGRTKTGVPLSGSDCLTVIEGPIRLSPISSVGGKFENRIGAYPNPFNAATVISFNLATDSHVRLHVFDVLGRRVATLVDDAIPAGDHQVSWDAVGAASGMYFARLSSSAGMLTRKMVLLQ